MPDKKFAEGIYFERRDNAPDFVVGKASFKVEKFVQFLKENVNNAGYVNVNILKAREAGKYYCELDQWKPTGAKAEKSTMTSPSEDYPDGLNTEDIGF